MCVNVTRTELSTPTVSRMESDVSEPDSGGAWQENAERMKQILELGVCMPDTFDERFTNAAAAQTMAFSDSGLTVAGAPWAV